VRVDPDRVAVLDLDQYAVPAGCVEALGERLRIA